MAKPLAYRTTRVTIQGSYAGGAEEWSTGFWFGAEGEDAALPDQALADGIRDAWTPFFTSATSYISNKWQCEQVKLSSFGTDGKSDANDTVYSTFGVVVGANAALHFPPQITLAATLTGANARGLASKGRMYIPGVVATLQDTGKINSASRDAIAANFKTFINAVNALPANNVVVLASHGQLTKNLDGDWIPKVGGYGPVNAAVQGVKLGDVYDTQRRRRNGLVETYTSLSLI